MKKLTLFIVSAILSFSTTAQPPIKFYLTPSVSKELMEKKGDFIKSFLEKETGLSIQMIIAPSYEGMVDAFGSSIPCFAFMSGQSYVLANQKYGATVKLRAIRYGHGVYYGMIVTKASSPIKNIKDLQGKTIAYTDALSTSGYLYPKRLLDKDKVKPGKELFVKKHDDVVKMVYEGKADAGAAFFSPPSNDGTIRDARAKLLDKYPDVEKKVVILTKTEAIPNDPIVFSKNFDPDTSRKIYMALVKLSLDKEGKANLTDLYGVEGFSKSSDSDYNSLRAVMGMQNK